MFNPYTPPESAQRDVHDTPARRPVAIWLFLLVIAVMTVIFAVGVVRFIWFIALHVADVVDHFALTTAVALRVALFAGALGALFGVWRRRQWGRWLGIFAIAAIVVMIIVIPDTTHYASDAERAGGFFGRMIFLPLLMAWWGYKFGFSSNSKRYFADSRLGNSR